MTFCLCYDSILSVCFVCWKNYIFTVRRPSLDIVLVRIFFCIRIIIIIIIIIFYTMCTSESLLPTDDDYGVFCRYFPSVPSYHHHHDHNIYGYI